MCGIKFYLWILVCKFFFRFLENLMLIFELEFIYLEGWRIIFFGLNNEVCIYGDIYIYIYSL